MATPQMGLTLHFANTVSTGQAALMIKRALGRMVSRQTIVRLIEKGEILGFRLHDTAQWSIERTSIERYCERIRETPPN